MHSGVSLATAVVVAVVLVLLGYRRAVWARAKRDYKTTKEAVPKLRKGLWRAIWQTVKIGAVAVVVYAVITGWFARDVTDHRNTPLIPDRIGHATPSPKPRSTCPGGWLRC